MRSRGRLPPLVLALWLLFERRLRDNWQMQGSWTIQKSTGLVPFFGPTAGGGVIGLAGPNSLTNSEGESGWSRRHVFKVTGTYLFPSPIGVNLGASFRHTSGYPWGRFATIFPPAISGFVSVLAEPRDANRTKAVNNLDLRVEKRFRLPGAAGSIHAYLDVFNALNTNTATFIIPFGGPFLQSAFDYVPPRLVRLGLAWRF